MFELLDQFVTLLRTTVDSPWLWVLLFLITMLDAVIPFSPSETTVVTVAVLVSPQTELLLLPVAVAAIGAFCIGGLGAFYVGRGELTLEAFELAVFSFLFFIGSTFYVKTMIREKKNERYKWLSWGYHALLVAGLIATGETFAVLAYAPSVVRAVYLYGKALPIMKLGILEIANAAYFFIAMIVLYS